MDASSSPSPGAFHGAAALSHGQWASRRTRGGRWSLENKAPVLMVPGTPSSCCLQAQGSLISRLAKRPAEVEMGQ